MLRQVLAGIANGIVISLLGYLKSSTVESFSPRKMLQTVVVGAVVGGVSGFYGRTYEEAYEWCANMGIITVVEYVKKAVIRYVRMKVVKREGEEA